MFDSFRQRARTVATLGVAAALVVAGVALAQGGSSGSSEAAGAPAGKRMPGPPPMMGGPGGKDLTYAELHVQRNGQAEVIRMDQGTIAAVGDSSVTLKENDGNEVTITVDDSTKVLAGPGDETAVSDLQTGEEVTVCGPEGGTAKTIMLPPKRGDFPPPLQGQSQMRG
jgi:hypothetical protein